MKKILLSGFLLATFGVVGVTILAITYQQTEDRITENYRLALMQQLMEVVGENEHNNDPLNDKLTLDGAAFNSSEPVTVYRVRLDNKPIGAVFVTTTPKGYAGSIQIIVGLRMDHSISGVRVVRHHETPGLGDKMEIAKSQWVLSFNNTSLQQPKPSAWGVKKDGGYFDQFTGATITPRAIVRAVRDVLLWAEKAEQFSHLFTLPIEVDHQGIANE
ncbi:MAG: electron transport complex subunit RsxG [Thiotrichaceae bacterium]|nr:electron transport complex subunit RsxG [Thiotrichaceae bacterium]